MREGMTLNTVNASGEAASRPIEEEIIARMSAGIANLPMLDIIFSRMSTDLTSAFKAKSGLLTEIPNTDILYRQWSSATAELDEFSICVICEAKPWNGSIVIALSPEFFFAALETQMSGTPAPGDFPRRLPSAIERRLAQHLTTVIAETISHNFARIDAVTFQIASVETPRQIASLQTGNAPCAISRMSLRIGECEGQVDVLIPLATVEPIQPKLVNIFLGERLGGDKTWREHLTGRINETSVNVDAVLTKFTTSLADVLGWKPGQVIDLGIAPDHLVTVTCSGFSIFKCQGGRRRNNRINLRVVHDAGETQSPLQESKGESH